MPADLNDAYLAAQRAVAELKAAVRTVLEIAGADGVKNSDIGRSLGIYMGHKEHEGHIPRTILTMLENEGIAEQIAETKKWRLRNRFN